MGKINLSFKNYIYIYINPRKQTIRKGLTFEIPI